MAESSGENNATASNDSLAALDDFCKNFTFSDSTTCSHCDIETSYNQPVCTSCHQLVSPTVVNRKRRRSVPLYGVGLTTKPRKIGPVRHNGGFAYLPSRLIADPSLPSTSGMAQPSSSRSSRPPLMLKDLNDYFSGGNNNNNEGSIERAVADGNDRERAVPLYDVGLTTKPCKVGPVRHNDGFAYLPSRLIADPSLPSTSGIAQPSSSRSSRPPLMLKDLDDFFSEGNNNNNNNEGNIEKAVAEGNGHINELPAEILFKIFADLDEKMLLVAGGVSKQWNQIVAAQQGRWKKFTERRWPLLKRKTETTNWFKMYTTLKSSCCCGICFQQMMQSADNNRRPKVSPRAKVDIHRGREVDGIRIFPLNGKLAYLQASITGPPDTPYEGGIFFLQIHVPPKYPFDPPAIKFLTKIIHPNISRHGDIGLDVVSWCYSIAQSLNAVLLSIQSILDDPHTQGCMEPELGRLYVNDPRRFDALARYWTKKYAMMDDINVDN